MVDILLAHFITFHWLIPSYLIGSGTHILLAQVCTFYWLKVYESYWLKVPHLTGTLNEPARLGSMSQQNLKAEASKI